MAESRKYYYLKLKESYFDEDAIILLESMPDGVLYSNLLLKLYLKSLRHQGRLMLGEGIPYNAQMIAAITRQPPDTVERALNVLRRLGLVELLEDGTLYLPNLELMVGRSSTEAERKRRAMLAMQGRLGPPQAGVEKIPPEIEREKEIEIEIETEKEREREKDAPARAYGRFENVRLTQTEVSALQTDLPHCWRDYVERLSDYMASTGRTYQNHAATIRRWAREDACSAPAPRGGGARSYDTEEEETI